MKAAVFALLALSFIAALAQNPGIKVAVSQAAIKNFNDNVLPTFVSQLQSIQIPDAKSGSLKVTGISVDRFSLPSNAVVAKLGSNHLELGTERFGIKVSAKASIKILLVKINVHVSASCDDSSVLTDIAFGYANGHPTISLKDFNVKIKKLHIKLGSNIVAKAASSIINFFNGPLQSTISYVISSTLKNVIASSINKALDRVPNSADMKGSPFSIAYNLVSAPVITPNFLTLAVNGTFYETSTGKVTLPITPAGPMPDYDSAAGSQIQLFLNQYVLDSGLYSAWHAGLLSKEFNYTVSDPSTNFKFNVDWLKGFVPQITQFYSLDSKLVLNVGAKTAPVITFKKDHIELAVVAGVALSAVVNETKVEIFAAESNINLKISLAVKDWALIPTVIEGTIQTLDVIRSSVGDIDQVKMLAALNQFAGIAIPMIDFSMARIPLPNSLDVDMTNTSLTIKDGYLQINANPVFKP